MGESLDAFVGTVAAKLTEMQNGLFERAVRFRQENTVRLDSLSEFREYFAEDSPGGFAWCHWSESPEMESLLKDLKVTARNIPIDQPDEPGRCIFTGAESPRRAVFSRAY